MLRKIFVLTSLILVLTACNNTDTPSSEVNLDLPNLMDYYLRVDETQVVRAEVFYKNQNDSISLPIKNVTLNGQSLKGGPYNVPAVLRYAINEPFSDKENFLFKTVLEDKTVLEHNFSVKPILSFSIPEGKISKSKGFTLNWDGEPVNPNSETLVLLITDVNGVSMSLNRIGETANTGLFITPPQLTQFAAGKGSIYLVKKTRIDRGVEKNFKVTANLEFYSTTLPIEITE